ncbi:hypothetical protein ACTMTI_35895 [Nonomuraea sp. H19]|uniref:hypothetical protein n=1 Tax=Nonomuraea sp. H19 TaxID=3452206 RepID=UPI003F890E09
MRRRGLVWGGAVVAVAALAALGVYFAKVGLAQADQLASVLGLFVAAAGLGVAIFGLWGGAGGGGVRQVAKARGNSRTYQAGRDLIQRPSVRPEPGAGDGGLDSDGMDRDVSRPVRQQARADDGSQVRQGGRDVIADADGDGSGR